MPSGFHSFKTCSIIWAWIWGRVGHSASASIIWAVGVGEGEGLEGVGGENATSHIKSCGEAEDKQGRD